MDLTNDNKSLHRITNETVKTNALSQYFIELYLENNPRKEKPVEKSSGAMSGVMNSG